MFFTIFKFELLQRLRRPETYLYFLLVTLGATVAVLFIYENTLGAVKENAPVVLAASMTISYAFTLLITSLIMGMPVLRDFRHQVAEMIYTKPISKRAYLGGRFLGSFVVVLLASSGLPLGIMLGELMPWRVADRLLPFHLWAYLQPYFCFVLPTVFFSSAVFFVSGALSRKLLVVYTQGVLFLVAYIVAMVLTRDGGSSTVSGLLDPFGFNTIADVTRYWTPQEKNATMVPLTGILLYNRLFWSGLGVLVLLWGYRRFSFNLIHEKRHKKRAIQSVAKNAPPLENPVSIAVPTLDFSGHAHLRLLWLTARFHTLAILRETAFWAIVICAVAIILVNSISLGTTYGVDSLPTTYLVIEELKELSGFFFLMILLFFSGEISWREREHEMHLMVDAMPVSNVVTLGGKLLGLMGIYTLLLLALVGSGVLFQWANGYTQFELPVYALHLYVDLLLFLGLYTILSFLAQAITKRKFVGHLLFILCFLVLNSLQPLGLAHPLYHFNAGELGTYSEMNGFGHFLPAYFWQKGYWLAVGILLFLFATLRFVRGTDSGRWFRRPSRNTRRAMIALGGCALLSGGYIYYQTNVLADFSFPATELAFRADYEKQLKRYEYLPQPKVVKVTTEVDIFPKRRTYRARGTYWIVNKTNRAIPAIHVQKQPARQLVLDTLLLDRPAKRDLTYQGFGYSIYQLETPLPPGDTLQLRFAQHFKDSGFPHSPETQIVGNGTFLKNDHFPSLGYQSRLELRESDERQAHGLSGHWRKRPSRDHPYELRHAVSDDDGYVIDFTTTLSTDTSQTAIAPGHLVRTWTQGDRRYYHYRMDAPMVNFYPFLSGVYAEKRAIWQPQADHDHPPVNFEIYYHPTHTANLDRMLRGLHAGMDYCTDAFGDYPYGELRIVEFPRYASYAQSFPGVIAYSEDLGFILDIDETEADMAFFVTVHELAHQWWGLQLAVANVEGRNMLLESLAQYTALMVMKKHYGQEIVDRLLAEERERYLVGRTKEHDRENALNRVQSQKYIHYGKGMVNLYAFQDYITEDCLNQALREFLADWNCFTGPQQRERYPTTADLMTYFRRVTPDSLAYTISDLFEQVTFYRHALEGLTLSPTDQGGSRVYAEVRLQKVRLDTMDVEHQLPVHDLLEVGIYDANDSLRYQGKHWLENGQLLDITVDFPAKRMVIDPTGKMMELE